MSDLSAWNVLIVDDEVHRDIGHNFSVHRCASGDIGVVPTPVLYWSLHHLDVVGGIQITGSHNPPEYNGFKMSVGKESLHGDGITHLHEIITAGKFPKGSGSTREEAVIDRYIDDVVANEIVQLPGGFMLPIFPSLVRCTSRTGVKLGNRIWLPGLRTVVKRDRSVVANRSSAEIIWSMAGTPN